MKLEFGNADHIAQNRGKPPKDSFAYLQWLAKQVGDGIIIREENDKDGETYYFVIDRHYNSVQSAVDSLKARYPFLAW